MGWNELLVAGDLWRALSNRSSMTAIRNEGSARVDLAAVEPRWLLFLVRTGNRVRDIDQTGETTP